MLFNGIEFYTIQTSRLNISYYAAGDSEKQPVILVHGNVSSSLFWNEVLKNLAGDYRVLAPDLRGYGETEPLPIDAKRGLRDWSDDLKAFADALEIKQPIHFIGWSMGSGVVMQYAIDNADDLASLTLINPISPYGFGGTKDIYGTPCYSSYAGSGGGTANPQFVELLRNKDRSAENNNSPLNVMNNFYFKPSFRADRHTEENYVDSMLSTKTGEGFYPGSFEFCEEWPGICPGEDGINNAMSPKYMNLAPLVDIEPKCPILWIRGSDDLIVSDNSFFDFGFLGKQGFVEGWPGEEVYPPQPMVSQTRHILDQYKEKGGQYEEFVIEDTGHSPHIEKPEVFLEKVRTFLNIE